VTNTATARQPTDLLGKVMIKLSCGKDGRQRDQVCPNRVVLEVPRSVMKVEVQDNVRPSSFPGPVAQCRQV
jgi:hypothetical protein